MHEQCWWKQFLGHTMKAMKINSLTWRPFFLSQFMLSMPFLSHKRSVHWEGKLALAVFWNKREKWPEVEKDDVAAEVLEKCLRFEMRWAKLFQKQKPISKKSVTKCDIIQKPVTSISATQKSPHHEVNTLTKTTFKWRLTTKFKFNFK